MTTVQLSSSDSDIILTNGLLSKHAIIQNVFLVCVLTNGLDRDITNGLDRDITNGLDRDITVGLDHDNTIS